MTASYLIVIRTKQYTKQLSGAVAPGHPHGARRRRGWSRAPRSGFSQHHTPQRPLQHPPNPSLRTPSERRQRRGPVGGPPIHRGRAAKSRTGPRSARLPTYEGTSGLRAGPGPHKGRFRSTYGPVLVVFLTPKSSFKTAPRIFDGGAEIGASAPPVPPRLSQPCVAAAQPSRRTALYPFRYEVVSPSSRADASPRSRAAVSPACCLAARSSRRRVFTGESPRSRVAVSRAARPSHM
jgi:hypothetical protein